MTHPTNPDGDVTVTDDEILNEFERRAIGVPLRLAGVPNLDGVRIIEGVRALLSATQPAAVDRGATPVAWLIDPGAGSAVDRFQQVEPYGWQYDEVEKRGGSITLLYAAPLDKDASKPAAIEKPVSAEYRCRKCGGAAEVKFSYASSNDCCRKVPCVRPGNGPCDMPARQSPSKSISDAMMDLADRLGHEWKDVDPRAWSRLLIYAPSVEQDERGALPDEVREALTHAAGGWRGAACGTRDDADGAMRSADYNRRAKVIEDWLAAPLDKDASKPVAYPSEHHDCVYSNGDGVCEECKALADAHVSLIGEGKSERASPAAPSVEQDERGAYPVVLTNDELNALTKERFGNMHAMYAEGFRRLMRTAIEANSKKARAVSTSANVAQDAEAVVLQHVAVAEDGGKLRWMTGRRPRDCELYAMPDGGRIPPKLYGAPPEQTALTDDARGAVLTEIRHAISDYHFALDLRAHGGIAQDHAFNTICKSLGMHWKQGEETARRALTAAQSASGG